MITNANLLHGFAVDVKCYVVVNVRSLNFGLAQRYSSVRKDI